MSNTNIKNFWRTGAAAMASLLLMVCLASGADAAVGINQQINFQGKVVNKTAGTNIANGNYDFVFKLYSVSSGGAAIWTETRTGGNQVAVTDGIFQVNLGSVTALPGSVDFNTDNIYLGIEFNSDGEMAPRVRFTAAPYAFNSDKVGGLGTSDLVVKAATANQTVTSTQTSGTVFGITDTTGISAAIKGLDVTLSGSGAFDQTGLEFNLSGASGTNLNDIVGSGSTWKVSTGGAATLTAVSTPSIITASGALTVTPAAGSNFNVNLSTTGDFAVNTDDFYVDTSAGNVGIGDTSPDYKLSVAGDIYTTGKFIGEEGASRGYSLSTRDALAGIFPVPSFRPTDVNENIAVDIMPNGTPTEYSNNGYAWLDVCDTDILTGNGAVTCGRMGARSDAIEIGSRSFNGAAAKPIYFTMSDGTSQMSIATNGNITFGKGTGNTSGGMTYLFRNAATNALSYSRITNQSGTINGHLDTYDATYSFDSSSFAGYTGLLNDTSGVVIGAYNGSGKIRFITGALANANTRMTITSTGTVGIGDTTPDSPLEILSTSDQLRLSYTDGSVDGTIAVNSSENLVFQAGTTSEIRNVQIGAGGAGSTTPDFFGLDVKSDTGDPAGGFEGAMYYNTLDNVFRCYQNTGWTNCIGSGGSMTVRESDASPSVSSVTTLEFGPASTSSEEFIVSDQTGGVARVILGTQVGKLNEAETVTGGWSFTTAPTAFSLVAQGTTDLVSLSSTWTGDNTSDALGITTTYNVSASTSTIYGLNLANADNGGSTGVIDALALFSNNQATETMADGVIIRHNAASGTLTDALQIENTTAGGTITNAINILETAGTVTNAINIGANIATGITMGTGMTTFLETGTIDISAAGAITGATGVSSTTGTFSSAIAANGGITFDGAGDTVGAHTMGGDIIGGGFILTDIGNTGTDFVASTGALTLAGVLTANGGISLSGSQSMTAAALSYVDLGLIVHNTTAVQGLRLPQAASATPSNPTSGEGYLAWDAAGNQLITYNGSSWSTVGGGSGISTVRESDGSPSVGSLTTLEFGPASTSSEEFIVSDQTGGVARVVIGTQVGKLNEAETVTGGWSFTTAPTAFSLATQGTTDLASLSSTWTGDNTSDVLGITTTYNVSASTSTIYGLNLANADNGGSTGVIDALALFSNNQATETLADGVIIRHNAASGTLTDGLQIENTTAGGTITNAISILETAGTVANAINIGNNIATGITMGTGMTTFLETGTIDISAAGAITGATGVSSTTGTFSSAIAANGGITFDASSDTIGSFTAGGAILMNSNNITGIGTNLTGAGAVTLASTTSTLTLDSGNNTLTIAANDTAISATGVTTLTLAASASIVPNGAAALTIGSASVTQLSLTTDNNAANDINIIGGVTFNDDGTFTLAGSENVVINNTTVDGAIDLVSINPTLVTNDVAVDGLSITLTDNLSASTAVVYGLNIINADNSTNTGVPDALAHFGNANAAETVANGLLVEQTAAGTMTNAIQVTGSAGTITNGILIADGTGAITNGIQMTGTFTTTLLDTPSIDISAAGAITGATGVSSTTGTFSSAIAANGGITFDGAGDTVGAHTLGGNVIGGGFILTDIGNTGTDFIASTGALTLAGVLTANGGISLAASQSMTAAALSYMDLGAIVHNTTAVQGLRLPQAASATPSNPSANEGYLAWDVAGNQMIVYNGSAWTTVGGGSGYSTIKDETTPLTQRSTLAFLGTGVSCADNASQTECTISSGGGPFTDGSGVTYLTDTAEALAVGSTSISDTGTKVQVGSATNRGDMTVYGAIVKKGLTDWTTLANITDVFVYDTTRDSDTGRWTESLASRALGWYTETKDDGPGDACVIATDDRCGQSSFPKKAILVTTPDALYVFDSDDNSLWMKFTQGGTFALGADLNNNPSSVFALNGVIYVGTNGAAGTGLYAFDFVANRMYLYNATNRSQGDKDIANRNTTVAYATDARTFFALVNAVVNDVHASVLSGSASILTNGGPLNGATFIAVATDAGLSVINLSSGRTLDYTELAGDDYNAVYLTRRGRLYGLNETQAQVERWGAIVTGGVGIDVDNADQLTPTKLWDENVSPARLWNSAVTFSNAAPDALEVIERGSFAEKNNAAGGGDIIYVGHNLGMTEIHDTNAANAALVQPWSKYYTTTYQTGYLTGTIKAMFPFSEASGDATSVAVNSFGLSLQPKGSTTPTYGVNGVKGTGASFNGTTAYFCSDSNTNDGVCDNDTDYNVAATAFNIQAWFKHSTTIAGTDVIISKRHSTTPAAVAGWEVGMNASGQIYFGIDDDTAWTPDDIVTSTQSFNDNQWHHLVAVNTDTALCLYIDGRLAVACDVALAATATLDGAGAILAVGADCSVGAACGTGANFWDGSIAQLSISSGGATTTDSLTQDQVVRMYQEGRMAMARRAAKVTDATTVSASTIGDTAESWIVNEFAGSIVEITGNTGVGQTRRVVSNTSNTLTVTPNWSTTPDTTSDFEVNPEVLYGAANGVTAIGSLDPMFLGESRKLFVGTSDGVDGGGLTVLEGMGTSVVTDVYHADSEKFDDASVEWTGTDRDDMSAVGANGRMVAFGSLAGTWAETSSHRLEENFDRLNNQIATIRMEMVHDLLGASSHEIGAMGADLAERYYSNETLEAGEVVSMDSSLESGVKRSSLAYQKNVIGVVATKPGIILGEDAENAYPVALAGRVPVKITSENGAVFAGDRLAASSRPGFAMKATQAGRVIGEALADASDWTVCEGEDSNNVNAKLCTTVMVFVNLSDYNGMPVELAMQEKAEGGLTETTQGLTSDEHIIKIIRDQSLAREEKVLAYLKKTRDELAQAGQKNSEVFTGRLSASTEVITPKLVAEEIFAKSIKADSIEGLEIFTNKISSLEEKYAGLTNVSAPAFEDQTEKSQGADKTEVLMKNLSVQSLMITLDGEIIGKLSIGGALKIGGEAEFAGESLFQKLATFFGDTLFKGKVFFKKAPTFGADTAGFAVIEKGHTTVHIRFDEAYEEQPVVAVSLSNDRSVLLDGDADEALQADVAAVEKDYVENVFGSDVRYLVTEKDARGFTIVLNKFAPYDLQFSWVALAVDKTKTFISERDAAESSSTVTPVVTLPPLNMLTNETNEKPPLDMPPSVEALPAGDSGLIPIENTEEQLPPSEAATTSQTDVSGSTL